MTHIRKAAYLAAADACRWAARQGWGACWGLMIDRDRYGQVSVCALGAMALRRALNDRAHEDFDIVFDDILYGSMAGALGMGSLLDAQDVSDRFDDFVADWPEALCAYGEAEEVWLQAAAMFDNLANS